MKWTSNRCKPEVTVHPYTSKIIVTNGNNSNLIPGYIYITVTRPTHVRSLSVAFTGTYSVRWASGVGLDDQEYIQHKIFHYEKIRLTEKNLVSTSKPRQTIAGPQIPSDKDLGSGWEEIAYDSSSSSEYELGPPSYTQDPEDKISRAQVNSRSFILSEGTHRFEFVIVVPPRMPSTVISHMGGITYQLSAYLKTRGHLGMSASMRTDCSIHIVNIPMRYSLMQTSLPINDEAIFTRQIEEAWWILVKVASCTTSPEDTLQLSACLSWPEKCGYYDNIENYLELRAVQMDLCESTVHRSIRTGEILKDVTLTIATSINGKNNILGDETFDSVPPSYDMIQAEDILSVSNLNKPQENDTFKLEDAILFAESHAQSSAERSEGQVRGMFNESHAREFRLRIPRQREMDGKSTKISGVHIDCRSAPISINHRLQITLKILDKVSQKLHLVPFHCRIIVIPEVESFLLPAYTSSLQDMRVQ
ncbi:hypothetical protein COEREDRAFT_8528 [Coemansia reversa NRRL 1564]|uniref:Arrestin-like N-terminal domain-containing protein n=1 Tax=Coemansia reversa (strain ATCC 12441 / NRRL 1564) TaxID=763665 RepID=A0A2G5BBM0_COERN|nr:hypothetical protein COEREDRAFT_8528 [Coemansia reversa NRRL 1564]|eukprot:PIA16409.1 hypothetical protein COEREDRAFT_8528 [Coemansia reversa NRRL 1564]